MKPSAPSITRPGLSRRAQVAALLSILLLAAALRVHDLTAQSFWIDEFASVKLCTGRGTAALNPPANVVLDPAPNLTGPGQDGPGWEVWTRLREDMSPPLYSVLLRFWRWLFGPGDAAARSLSVLASLMGILFLFAAGRRLHGAGAALWACLIMALATPQIEFAQEARAYALVMMWGLACIWAFLRLCGCADLRSPIADLQFERSRSEAAGFRDRKSSIANRKSTNPSPQPSPPNRGKKGQERRSSTGGSTLADAVTPSRAAASAKADPTNAGSVVPGPPIARYVILAACLLGAMLTHYYVAGPLAGLLAFAIVRLRGRARRNVLLTFAAAGVVYLIIWGPFFWGQMHATIISSDWSLEPREGNLWRTVLRIGVLPYECLGPRLKHSDGVAALSGVLFVLPFAMARRRPEFLLWGFWLAGAVGLVAGEDLWRSGQQLAYLRYTLCAAPGIYMVLASVLWNRDGQAPWMRHALPLIAVLCCVVNLPQAYVQSKADWRILADCMRQNQRPGDAYVFASLTDHETAVSQVEIYYAGITHYTGPLPGPAMLLYARATPEQLAALTRASGTGHIWLVPGLGVDSPDQILPGAKIEATGYSPGLGSVWRITLK